MAKMHPKLKRTHTHIYIYLNIYISDSEWLFGPRSCCCFGCCNFAQVHFTGQDWTGVVVPASHSSPWVPAMLRCCGCFSQHFCAQGSYGKVYLAKDRLPKMDTFVTVVITNIPLALIFKSSWGHCAIAFGSSFFWGRLVQPVTTSPFPFLSSPLLPLRASPPQTSKNHQKWTGSVSRKTSGFKQGNRILGKALRLTELRTASLKTTGFKPGSQLCCLGRFGGEKRGNDWGLTTP